MKRFIDVVGTNELDESLLLKMEKEERVGVENLRKRAGGSARVYNGKGLGLQKVSQKFMVT